jgi:hypothetical protein
MLAEQQQLRRALCGLALERGAHLLLSQQPSVRERVVVRAERDQVAQLVRPAFRARMDVVHVQRKTETAEHACVAVAGERETSTVAPASRLDVAPSELPALGDAAALVAAVDRLARARWLHDDGLGACDAGPLNAPVRRMRRPGILGTVCVSTSVRAELARTPVHWRCVSRLAAADAVDRYAAPRAPAVLVVPAAKHARLAVVNARRLTASTCAEHYLIHERS